MRDSNDACKKSVTAASKLANVRAATSEVTPMQVYAAPMKGARITIPRICEEMNSSVRTSCSSANVVALLFGHPFRVFREDWI